MRIFYISWGRFFRLKAHDRCKQLMLFKQKPIEYLDKLLNYQLIK